MWLSNTKFIEDHNAEEAGFEVAMNAFGDLVRSGIQHLLQCTLCNVRSLSTVVGILSVVMCASGMIVLLQTSLKDLSKTRDRLCVWKAGYCRSCHIVLVWHVCSRVLAGERSNVWLLSQSFPVFLSSVPFPLLQDPREFAKKYNGYQSRPHLRRGEPFTLGNKVSDLPTTVDWRTKGYVTGIKNQVRALSCCSGWV